MDQLASKVAVVTGGASGIGLALARSLAAEGMKLVLADVDDGGLDQVRSELEGDGADVLTVHCDVSDQGSVEALRDQSLSRFGAVHVICNNAGVGGGGSVWDAPIETWRWVMGVNFFGVIHGIRAFVPLLIEQGEGHVVNTASAAGIASAPFMGSYCASKHAVVTVSEILAMELQLTGKDVKASVLCPMFVRTRIHESDRNAPDDVRAAVEGLEDSAGFRDIVTGLVEGGIPPEQVAGDVVSAVKEGRFWIFPHEEVKQSARTRGERIATETAPAFEMLGIAGL